MRLCVVFRIQFKCTIELLEYLVSFGGLSPIVAVVLEIESDVMFSWFGGLLQELLPGCMSDLKVKFRQDHRNYIHDC